MDYSCAGSLDLFLIFSCRPCAPLVRRSVAWRRRLSPCSLSAFFLRHWSQLDSIYGISLREVWTFWITAYRKFSGQKSCTQNKSFKPTCPETPQASQADVTGVLCKLTFSRESRCRVTSNRWDFLSEIKYCRPQYFIPHTQSQRLLVTRHRISCEKVDLHNTIETSAWDACG